MPASGSQGQRYLFLLFFMVCLTGHMIGVQKLVGLVNQLINAAQRSIITNLLRTLLKGLFKISCSNVS